MADYTGIYNWGKPVGIQVRYRVLEDSTKAADASATFVSGRVVYLNDAGVLAPVTGNVRAYGVSRATRNTFVDEIGGSFGFYGSSKLSVVKKAIAIIKDKLVFTNADGTETEVEVYDSAATFNVGDPVYVNVSGQMTDDTHKVGAATLVGYVSAKNATTGELEVAIDL